MNDKTHDLITIGAGPAALAAAVYTAREDIETTHREGCYWWTRRYH